VEFEAIGRLFLQVCLTKLTGGSYNQPKGGELKEG